MNAKASPSLRRTLIASALACGLALTACSDSPEDLLGKAKEAIANNEPKAAEIHLKNLLQKADNAEARLLLGTMHLKEGDPRSAEKELTRARDGGIDPARIAVPLAEAQMQLGEVRAVIETAAKASPATPEEKARLATLAGRAHFALGSADAARSSFESALKAAPEYVPAEVGLISLQAARGDIQGASAATDRLLGKHPNAPEALVMKGDLELVQRHPREAREFFRKAIAADPLDRQVLSKIVSSSIDLEEYEEAQKSLDELRRLSGPAAATLQLQAQIHARQGKLDQARSAIEASLKAAPDYLPSLALGAQIYLQSGVLEQAERLARKVVERTPQAPQGYQLLAATLLRMNAPDRALQALQPILDRNPTDPGLYALAGEAALRNNDAAQSAKWFAKSLELDPRDPRKQTGLALAQLAGGERERGIAALERISLSDPSGTQSDLALISTHLNARQWDKALAAIDQLQKKQPDSAMAANLRGSALVGKGDVAGGRKAFEQALARDPKFLGAATNLATLDMREGKPEQARKRYTTLLEADPKNVSAMLALAQLTEGSAPRGDAAATEAALGWLTKARDTDRASLPAALALSNWYINHDRSKEAIPILQEALNSHPDAPQVLSSLGVAYLRTDQDALGMETFERVLRARPNDPALHMRMGQLKLSRKDTAGALASFRKASDLAPKALEPRLAMVAALGQAGRFEEARQIAAALQREAPGSPAGQVVQGDIAMSQRQFPEAAAAYRRALAIQRTLPIEMKLHQSLVAGGNTGEADTFLRGLLRARPDDLALRMYAGDREVAARRWAEAIAHYDVILAKQPGNALALNNAAWARHEMGDPKALDFAERAVKAAPNSAATLDTLAVILSGKGEHQRALENFKQALSAAPNAAQIRLHFAEALAAAGDKAGARSELDTLQKDAPADSPLADRVRQLRDKL